MKKIIILAMCFGLLFNSCAATFGTKNNQSAKQRKTDKIVSRTILGALVIGAVIVVITANENK